MHYLHKFITNNSTVGIKKRKELLLDAFTGKKSKALPQTQNSFAILVKKLQESLTRMDAFEVITVTQNTDGTCKQGLRRQLLTHPQTQGAVRRPC
jgi:hypothetical protein